MTSQQQILSELISLAESDSGICALWLYGSRARRVAQAESDFDLAVLFEDYEQDITERRLRPEILAINWQDKIYEAVNELPTISVVDITLAPVPLAYTIVSDNSLLFTRDELKVMFQEQRIMSKWEIDYLHHVRHYA